MSTLTVAMTKGVRSSPRAAKCGACSSIVPAAKGESLALPEATPWPATTTPFALVT